MPAIASEALRTDCASIIKTARVGRVFGEGGAGGVGGSLYQQAQTLFGEVISGSVLNTVCAELPSVKRCRCDTQGE